MQKLISALGAAAVILPMFQPVLDTIGGDAGTAAQVGGLVAVAATKAVVDVQAALDKRKAKKARQRAANR